MAGPPFTIDTTTPAPTNLVSNYPSNEVTNRTNILNWLSWLSDPTTGLLKSQAFAPGQIFPTGGTTSMLFYQATAPVGWVQKTTVNDATLRVVNNTSTGGSFQGLYGFSTLFGPTTILNTTDVSLTVSQLPAHSHTYSGITGTESNIHTHNINITGVTDLQGDHVHGVSGTSSGAPGGFASIQGSSVAATGFIENTGNAGIHSHNVSVSGVSNSENQAHTHSFSGTTDNQGSGAGHHHQMALNVIFADIIICTKT